VVAEVAGTLCRESVTVGCWGLCNGGVLMIWREGDRAEVDSRPIRWTGIVSNRCASALRSWSRKLSWLPCQEAVLLQVKSCPDWMSKAVLTECQKLSYSMSKAVLLHVKSCPTECQNCPTPCQKLSYSMSKAVLLHVKSCPTECQKLSYSMPKSSFVVNLFATSSPNQVKFLY